MSVLTGQIGSSAAVTSEDVHMIELEPGRRGGGEGRTDLADDLERSVERDQVVQRRCRDKHSDRFTYSVTHVQKAGSSQQWVLSMNVCSTCVM